MSQYQITDLEKLTGIKAHTIRIWEKRYGIITPHRTSTNIRYYDDEQARKLLNVATLLGQGMKISKISALSNEEINEKIRRGTDTSPEDVVYNTFINELISSMLSFNESAFEKAFSSATNRFGIYNAMVKILYPFLHKTGLLWSINEAMPVQEHFASHIIKRKLMAAIDGLPVSGRKKMSFVLFLPSNEWHDIGLLFSDYILRSKGIRSFYLGPNVPLDDVLATVKEVKPTHLLTFFTTRRRPESVANTIQYLVSKSKDTKLLAGGYEGLFKGVKMPKELIYIKSPDDFAKYVS
ncbi:MAG: MerR family transcriptional regulator [Bacteroidia bacterium]